MSDVFRLEFEADVFEKAGDVEKSRKIGGYASTERLDRQKEIVVQKGLDFSDFLSHGWFNDNHSKNMEDVVGYPEKAEFVKGKGWYVEGYLLKDYPKADKIWELAKALQSTDRRLGFSIEGKVLEKKDNKILKAQVTHVAVTHVPVNPDCSLEVLAKSMDDGSTQELEPMIKQDLEGAKEDKNAKRKCKKGDKESDKEENCEEREEKSMTQEEVQAMIEKALASAKLNAQETIAKSEAKEDLAKSRSIEDGIEVSDFLENLVDGVGSKLDKVAKSLQDSTDVISDMALVIKSLAERVDELTEEVNEFKSTPVGVKKSVTQYVERFENESQPTISKADVMAKLEQLVQKGEIPAHEVIKFEMTGELAKSTQQKILEFNKAGRI